MFWTFLRFYSIIKVEMNLYYFKIPISNFQRVSHLFNIVCKIPYKIKGCRNRSLAACTEIHWNLLICFMEPAGSFSYDVTPKSVYFLCLSSRLQKFILRLPRTGHKYSYIRVNCEEQSCAIAADIVISIEKWIRRPYCAPKKIQLFQPNNYGVFMERTKFCVMEAGLPSSCTETETPKTLHLTELSSW